MTESERPAEHMDEEPQGERGEPGSRDEGFPPGGGPADRPAGTSDEESDTSVDPNGSEHEHSPDMPTA